MTIEPGHIEVICGCMFSGKTSVLLDRIAQARAGRVQIHAFKHASDTRYAKECLCAHSGRSAEAVAIDCAEEIEACVNEPGLIAVDEGQFFDDTLPTVCRNLARRGHAVVVAGLDLDSWGLPFAAMQELIGQADHVTRLTARCAVCGQPAERTQRLAPVTGDSMVAGATAYEPRCIACFSAPPITLRR